MSDLIEKVARMLCWKHGSDPDMSLGGDKQNFLWMEWEDEAEAAIAVVLRDIRKLDPYGEYVEFNFLKYVEENGINLDE